MKARLVIVVVIIVAFAAGFLVGWQRVIHLVGCPPSKADQLQEELHQVQDGIKKANRKIFQLQEQRP